MVRQARRSSSESSSTTARSTVRDRVKNCSKATLQAVIRGKVEPECVVYSDGWRTYNGLVDVSYGKYLRVDRDWNDFAKGKIHINVIESIWGFAELVFPVSEG